MTTSLNLIDVEAIERFCERYAREPQPALDLALRSVFGAKGDAAVNYARMHRALRPVAR